MKTSIFAFLVGGTLLASACGGDSSDDDVVRDFAMTTTSTDMATASSEPTLTVDNTISWCDVTVTVGSAAAVMFSDASDTFMATSGTTVTLTATPKPSFFPVQWTGVTTMNGSSATYVMTGAATQSVTACCPTSASGGGC